jgi:hypothetical protein
MATAQCSVTLEPGQDTHIVSLRACHMHNFHANQHPCKCCWLCSSCGTREFHLLSGRGLQATPSTVSTSRHRPLPYGGPSQRPKNLGTQQSGTNSRHPRPTHAHAHTHHKLKNLFLLSKHTCSVDVPSRHPLPHQVCKQSQLAGVSKQRRHSCTAARTPSHKQPQQAVTQRQRLAV